MIEKYFFKLFLAITLRSKPVAEASILTDHPHPSKPAKKVSELRYLTYYGGVTRTTPLSVAESLCIFRKLRIDVK